LWASILTGLIVPLATRPAPSGTLAPVRLRTLPGKLTGMHARGDGTWLVPGERAWNGVVGRARFRSPLASSAESEARAWGAAKLKRLGSRVPCPWSVSTLRDWTLPR